ncbi:hypothetical protein SCACP_35980 [Sporomusa carbonis]|uniref:carbohydrate-binding protein n=1 Tax=Sporomusa carbonis TaxID=3076075 RepID=UPI003A618907
MLKTVNTHYDANGVFIRPAFPTSKDIIKITYNGLLSQSGASEIYAHVGFGRNWEDVRDYKMVKTMDGFETSVTIPKPVDTFHVCFKDSANNWDNNSGINYNYSIYH